MKQTIYAGTYTGTGSQGIYRFVFEDGVFGEPEVFCQIKSPKYIAPSGDGLVTVADFPNGSGAALVSSGGEILHSVAYEGNTSCYIMEADDYVYTANYHAGTFTVLKKEENTLKLVRSVQIREGAGCHQVLLWQDRILVPCLFLDRVMIYDREFNRLGSIHFNVGTGPRHGIFTKDGKILYLVSELSNELFVIECGTWKILSSISVLPNNEKNQRDTAAVRLSDDEKYLYVSTRTKDVISVIDLQGDTPELIQVVSCGGRHPRDFILCGNWLLSANRFTNDVTAFAVHADGTIGRMTGKISIPEPVSLFSAD